MSRRLPLCASCGERLTSRQGTVIYTFDGVLGRPMMGEHFNCPSVIPKGVFARGKLPLAPALRLIAARGPDRVMLLRVRGRVPSLDEVCADADRLEGGGA